MQPNAYDSISSCFDYVAGLKSQGRLSMLPIENTANQELLRPVLLDSISQMVLCNPRLLQVQLVEEGPFQNGYSMFWRVEEVAIWTPSKVICHLWRQHANRTQKAIDLEKDEKVVQFSDSLGRSWVLPCWALLCWREGWGAGQGDTGWKDASEMVLVLGESCKGENRLKAIGAVEGSHLASARETDPIDIRVVLELK